MAGLTVTIFPPEHTACVCTVDRLAIRASQTKQLYLCTIAKQLTDVLRPANLERVHGKARLALRQASNSRDAVTTFYPLVWRLHVASFLQGHWFQDTAVILIFLVRCENVFL